MSDLTIPARLVAAAFGGPGEGWRVRFDGRPAIVTRAVLTSRSPWVDLIYTGRPYPAGRQPRAVGLNAGDSRMEIVVLHTETAFGLAQKLAMWAGDDGEAEAYWLDVEDGRLSNGWCLRSFRMTPARHYTTIWRDRTFQTVDAEYPDATRALAGILTVIGQDHAIRRALGWGEPKPGTLATLALRGGDPKTGIASVWTLEAPGFPDAPFQVFHDRPIGGAVRHVPALVGITDPNEARAALYAEVCGG